MDLALRDVLLELGQRRRRVGAVEPADGHDRLTTAQLVAGRVVRVHRGGRPGVLARRRAAAPCSMRRWTDWSSRTLHRRRLRRLPPLDGTRPHHRTRVLRPGARPFPHRRLPRSGGAPLRGTHRHLGNRRPACRRGTRRRRPGGRRLPGKPPAPPGKPPPGPPAPPAGVGVADGMAPVCGVAAVATVEKSGAASAAPKPSVATSTMATFGMLRSSGRARIATTPSAPTTTTKGRRAGNQSEVRPRRMELHTTVAASPAARPRRPTQLARRCQRPMVAMPTSAPSGGASATV